MSMLLARKMSSNKSINNAVESSFQTLLDLGGAGGAVWATMDKESDELEAINIWDRKLGSWHGSMVRKTEENVIQTKKLRNTVPMFSAVGKWLWNAGRWVWSTKVNGGTRERLSRLLNGASQFVGRPEGQLQWQANCQAEYWAKCRDFLLLTRFFGRLLADLSSRSSHFVLHVRDPLDSHLILDRSEGYGIRSGCSLKSRK
jgi:hypothetical protein